jgi:hypothetical protein
MRIRLAIFVALAMIGAYCGNSGAATPDHPVRFGYKTAWLAVRSSDGAQVAKFLGLQNVRSSTWQNGIDTAEDAGNDVFVSSAIRGWTFVVGFAVCDQSGADKASTPIELLERLSARFGEAQFYGSMRVADAYAWARAVHGRIVRAYEYDGSEDQTLLDIGSKTSAERGLDFQSLDEDTVLRVARAWSIDPGSLDERSVAQVGLVGELRR